MRVDESWCHDESIGVDFTATSSDVIADVDDPISLYRDVASSRRVPGSVDDDTVSYYQI
jgi:hypothetical protein